MSFVVQNDDGDVEGANSYLSLADFAAYHADRGNTVPAATDAQKQAALIRATDYLDERFQFRGRKLNGNEQTTSWPRYDAYDNDREAVYGIPRAVLDATAEYGLRALTATLNPDPVRDENGRRLQSYSIEVAGAVKEASTYANDGKVELPEYPAADLKLIRAGLIQGPTRSGNVRRA